MGNPIHPFPFSKSNPKNGNTKQADSNLESAPMGWPSHKSVIKKSAEENAQKPMLPLPPPPPPSPTQTFSLIEPERRHHRRGYNRHSKGIRLLRSLCRTFPIFTPNCVRVPTTCKTISGAHNTASGDFHPHPIRHTVSSSSSSSAIHITGTLFGHRKGRVSFAFQQTPRCLPTLVIELAIQTHALLHEIGSGMVRIALECEKLSDPKCKDRTNLLEEPLWNMYCNGKKCGYGVRREANKEDLMVMETLSPVSMGAGVIPSKPNENNNVAEGELAYVRAYFEHVVGSRDSETLYMLSPDGKNGPELTIFFVRI